MSQRNSRTIYVGNLPGDIHEREVEDLFYEYGPIIDIDLKIPPRPPGYAFIEFEDPRDTEDAIRGRDGYNFDGHKLRVELAHGGRNQSSSLDRHRSYNSGGHRGGASRRTEYRVMITGLPAFASWQDLKDHMRQAGDVCFSEVFDIGQGTIGIVDYTNYDDMQCAIKKLDDSEFRNAFSRAYIRVVEYDSERSLSRSRSPSRSYSRSVSPTHSRSRSRSRSKSPKAQSSRHPLSSSRSRSASSHSHSISRFGLKQESLDWILGSGSHFSSSTFIEDKTQENRERMPKKKDGQSENANSNKANNQCLWNKVMDDALIDAYLNQHNTGNRVDGTFTIHAFENIVNELKEKFPDKLIDKDKVQNRMKHIKRDWFSCYDIFKNSMSGFAWDPITEFFSAEPEAWQQLIEIKPTATEWKSKPIRNYEKLVQLYGKDNATGQHANTALEIQKRRASMEVENNIGENQFETIDEVGFIISQQEIHLDNSNAINEDVQIPTPSSEPTKSQANSFVGASLKNKSAKKGKVDDDNISKAIDHVAQAIMSSTHEMVKSNELPIPENEVWSLLTQLGVEQYRISKCYLYLVQRPKMVRALLGCPFEYRKDLVFQMMDEENILHD